MKMGKKGVSLVTVLLFMLVATIAATATFKWLNSEGRSSASRMMQNEARLAAIAGIESARSWMTYHGNETGALLKQFFEGDKKPILLNDVLNDIDGSKQNFKVALVGANIGSSTYKFKLISTGTSRNGTTHSEVAILKISGLYRTTNPTVGQSIDFNYAYVGGSTTYSGQTDMNALIINGNWSGNPPKTTKGDFVVTGNATLSGNEVNVAGTTCIGGNLDANNGITTKDLYVENSVSGTALQLDVSGNAYLNGNVTQGNQPMTIGGSLTLKGVLKTNASANTFSIAKNLCVEEGGQIRQDNFNRAFTVTGNVWMPHQSKIPVYTGSKDANSYDKIILGNMGESKVYIEDGYPYSNYVTMRNDRTTTEDPAYKKKCASSTQGYGGWSSLTYCYNWTQWGNLISSREEYDCSWKTYWGTTVSQTCYRETSGYEAETYSPYVEVSQKENMYYFYYMPAGVNDVEFGTYATNIYNWGGMYYGGTGSEKATLGGYYVGGNLFHNAETGAYNYLNTDKDANTLSSTPYCYYGTENRPQCGVSPWFTTKGEFSNSMPSTKPFTCAEEVKDHCDSIWEPGSGCDGAKYTVKELLQTGYSAFKKYANTSSCAKAIIGMDGNSKNNFDVSKINDCYSSLKSDPDSAKTKLYNGYLVLEMPDGTWFKNPSGTLNGKYIFIISGGTGEALKVPSTTSSSYVMLYLEKGWNNEIQQTGSGPFNYFLYSKGDIEKMMNSNWNGTLYMPLSGCWKIKNFQSSVLEYNKTLMNDMTNNGLICAASASTCGGAASEETSEESSSSSSYNHDGYDGDFIAIGPQLHIELESEYKNDEDISESDTTKFIPSIVVLPRIIYLTQDPAGKLSDYYTVIPLNGADATGAGSASCSAGSPPTSGEMVTGSELLEEGFFTCTYTEGGYKSKFYISVSGVSSDAPKVRFETPSDVKLSSGESSSQTVNMVFEGTGAASAEYSVDITVQHPDLEGWTLTPAAGVVERTGSTGDKIFTYTGNTTSGTTTIPLFTITTEKGAKSGSMIFIMQTPINCTISSPAAKSYSIYGSATIVRKELSEYCSANTCTAEQEAAIKREECDFGGIWVNANGSGCNTSVDNEKWICDAGNGVSSPITLIGGSYESKYCELFIPTENNSITGAKDDSTYTLYASIKKRKFDLHVGFSGTTVGKIKVKTKENATDEYTTLDVCSNQSDGCDYSLYVNTYVEVEVDANGDYFNYWLCSGSSCSSSQIPSTTYGFVMDNNYSITGKFNARDEHCFYTDFANTSIWCSSDDQMDCIDYCKSGDDCDVSNTHYAKANWNMVHANKTTRLGGNSFEKPEVDARLSSNSYLHYEGGSDNKNGIAMILNTAPKAGYNGTFTTRLKTGITCYEKNAWKGCYSDRNSYMLNSGFVFRSNSTGTEYISLSLYATAYSAAGIALGYAEHTYARACYVNQLKLSSSGSNCTEVEIKTKLTNSIFDYYILVPLNIDVTLNDNKMSISATYSKTAELIEGVAEIDLNNIGHTLADDTHKYLGIKLDDDKFRVGDVSWTNADYSDECFAEPSVSCSFSSNYLGGYVPLNEKVSPWVGFSSWFANEGKSCITNVKYYYNGCDVDYSYYQSGLSAMIQDRTVCKDISSDGYYTNLLGEDGLRMRSEEYNFQYEGAHGVTKGDGIVRNASVEVDCRDLNGHKYESDCGYFYVGEMHSCTDNSEIFTGSDYITSDVSTYSITGGVVNMRNATLNVMVDGLPDGEKISVKLVDEDGNESMTGTGSIDGNNEIIVDDISDAPMFNPEKVKYVKIYATSSCTLKSLSSSCPYAVNISNCSASYSGELWTLTSTLENSDKALKCMITSTDVSASEDDTHLNKIIDCNKSGTFTVNDADFYATLNGTTDAGNKLKYSFTINVYNDADATVTSKPSATCVAESNEYSQADVSNCSIDGNEVFQGGGVPKLSYSIVNCPDFGCHYDVKLSDGTTLTDKDPATAPAAGLNGTWKPSVNLTTVLSEGKYHYTVTARNEENSKTYSVCESSDFTVKKVVDAKGSCSISGDILYMKLTGANNKDVTVTVYYGDNVGNLIGTEAISMNAAEETKQINLKSKLSGTTAFNIKMLVSGNTVECGSYTPESSSSSTESSSSAKSSSSVSGSVTGTCVVKFDNSEITSTYTGNSNVSFSAKSVTGSKAENQTMSLYLGTEKIKDLSCHIYTDGSGSCWNGDNVTMPSTAGSYTYDLKYNGNTVCSTTLDIKDAVTCSVDQAEVSSGTKVTFTGTGNSPGAQSGSCGFKINGSWKDNNQNQNLSNGTMEYTITGTTVLTFECTQGKASNRSCSKTVSVTEAAPSFDCDETTAVVGASNNVTITPKNVSGCTNGCAYTISGTSVATSSFTYDSGALPSFTGSGTNGTTVTYEVSLTNSVATTSKNCSVKYQNDGGSSDAGEICLAGTSGSWPQTSTNTAGEYVVKHNCNGSQWFYNCTGTVTYGGNTLNCNGSEHNGMSVSSMPSSGSILKLSSGAEVSKIGCDNGSHSQTLNCSSTKVTTPGSSSSSVSWTSLDKTTSNSNLYLNAGYSGNYRITTGQQFTKVQIQSNCPGGTNIEINGSYVTTRSYDGYYDGSMVAGDPIEIKIPTTCTVNSLYFSK